MSKTRNNHYVPEWYQKGFLEPGRNTYAYLDLTPRQHKLSDGRVVTEKSKFDTPTSRAFRQRDLYSMFFGTAVSDEIERKLFGDIDVRGARAVRAFMAESAAEWHRHFTTFFEYLDVQKLRTPKGLSWLSAQYPRLSQNELMFEMQGIRMLHCTIWTEGVREIVSAQDTDIKFIVSDHPVTIYNYAARPDANDNGNSKEPSIALKASQTIFPLSRNFCLVLTNLEYAQDHSANPLEKRAFAGNYRNSMTRTDAFIRTRKLRSEEVIRFNRVLKTGANRYIAGGKEEWLYPEALSVESWADLRSTFLPPKRDLGQFGGEIFVGFDDGEVLYQDAFGRNEKEREFLKKNQPPKLLRAGEFCGCGSGRTFGNCCKRKPVPLRPTWQERSIRERNLTLFKGISEILGINEGFDWTTVRREITDEKIKHVYGLYDALWPRETNLLAMLPKPDGTARAIYTGVLHPSVISRCAIGLSLFFDNLLIEHPFIHPKAVKKNLSPLSHPEVYRQEFLKSVVLFMTIMPLVDQGLVTLFPDPCIFDLHLRDQMLAMAEFRSKRVKIGAKEKAESMAMMNEEFARSMLLLPREALRHQILRVYPKLDEEAVDDVLDTLDRNRESDPLAVLQEGSLEGSGQLMPFKLAPNFEITMYMAQATGSCIVTDSAFRWGELVMAAGRGLQEAGLLMQLQHSMEGAEFSFPNHIQEIGELANRRVFERYPMLMRKAFKYLSLSARRPNVEASLNAEFRRAHASTVSAATKSGTRLSKARISCLWPAGGIQDNTVNRLLLMSSSEHHLMSAPMALFVRTNGP